MKDDGALVVMSLLWLLIAVLIFARHWRTGRGVGLVFTYVLSFGALYWLVPTVYLLPWYDTGWHDQSVLGLRFATIALAAFAGGGEIALALLRRRSHRIEVKPTPVRAAWACLIIGAILYGVISPVSHFIASLGAVVSVGSTLVVAGFVLHCWEAWRARDFRQLWIWLVCTCALPFFTVVGQGFLGYGFAAMLTIFAFVASVYRPRWKVVVAGLALSYVGLSVFVTYMRDRHDIRATVWGGAAVDQRLKQVQQTASGAEWFDLRNPDHLGRLDERMNQDRLLGEAVNHLAAGIVPYAHGGTLIDAALAVVPRALWPEKQQVAGSGDLVARYTGLSFGPDTSVGIGQVMECYVNFGLPGVVAGFLVIGWLVVTFDRFAGHALRNGDAPRFLLWYLPGLSLLLIGGSFVEVTSSAGASWILARLVGRFALSPPRSRRRRVVVKVQVER
jgi:hypothetical protein